MILCATFSRDKFPGIKVYSHDVFHLLYMLSSENRSSGSTCVKTTGKNEAS